MAKLISLNIKYLNNYGKNKLHFFGFLFTRLISVKEQYSMQRNILFLYHFIFYDFFTNLTNPEIFLEMNMSEERGFTVMQPSPVFAFTSFKYFYLLIGSSDGSSTYLIQGSPTSENGSFRFTQSNGLDRLDSTETKDTLLGSDKDIKEIEIGNTITEDGYCSMNLETMNNDKVGPGSKNDTVHTSVAVQEVRDDWQRYMDHLNDISSEEGVSDGSSIDVSKAREDMVKGLDDGNTIAAIADSDGGCNTRSVLKADRIPTREEGVQSKGEKPTGKGNKPNPERRQTETAPDEPKPNTSLVTNNYFQQGSISFHGCQNVSVKVYQGGKEGKSFSGDEDDDEEKTSKRKNQQPDQNDVNKEEKKLNIPVGKNQCRVEVMNEVDEPPLSDSDNITLKELRVQIPDGASPEDNNLGITERKMKNPGEKILPEVKEKNDKGDGADDRKVNEMKQQRSVAGTLDVGIARDGDETIPMQAGYNAPSERVKLQPIPRMDGMDCFLLIVHGVNTEKSEMFA